MSQKSSLYRTIEILKHLNEGGKLCVTRLAQEYEVSDRTIRRDFGDNGDRLLCSAILEFATHPLSHPRLQITHQKPHEP